MTSKNNTESNFNIVSESVNKFTEATKTKFKLLKDINKFESSNELFNSNTERAKPRLDVGSRLFKSYKDKENIKDRDTTNEINSTTVERNLDTKRSKISKISKISKNGKKAININENDLLSTDRNDCIDSKRDFFNLNNIILKTESSVSNIYHDTQYQNEQRVITERIKSSKILAEEIETSYVPIFQNHLPKFTNKNYSKSHLSSDIAMKNYSFLKRKKNNKEKQKILLSFN